MESSFFENSGLCIYEKIEGLLSQSDECNFQNKVGCKQMLSLEMWDVLNTIKNVSLLNVELYITIVAVLAS